MTRATAAAGPASAGPAPAGTAPAGRAGQRAANYRASRRLVTPGRLREFFAPRSISMVGASDNSGWARFIVTNCGLTGFTGPLTVVHPTAKSAFGLPAVPSLRDLDEPPDLAFILAPLRAVESVLDDMGAAGVRSAVVLASGYREVGAAGRALEDSMVSRAIANDVTVLGPNCLGYLNAHTGAAPYALTLPPPLTAGGVGIALQSGALASVVLTFAKAHAIGLSVLTSVGNESMMKTVDVIDYFVEDPATRVIALFLEEIGDPVRFAEAAARADAAGKPIVALKVGSSPAGQQAALAHTGSVAGDDAVVSAALRQMNIVRVTSLEELLTTAALLARSAAPRGRRMGVLSASGGACDIIADAASAQGISIPDFSPATEAAIAAVLPPFASARNPLDVTGYGGLANLGVRTTRSAIDVALDAAADDPNLDFILYTGLTLPAVRPPDEATATMTESKLDWFAQRVASSPIPVIPVSSTCVDLAGYGREQLTSRGLYLLPGLNGSIAAIGNALRWAENRGSRWAAADAAAATGGAATSDAALGAAMAGGAAAGAAISGPWSEARARDLLTAAGVPVVPGGLARSADEAAELAARVGLPVALKVCSAQITHKSDIGGVALGLRTEADVRAGYEKVRAAGARAIRSRAAGAEIEGVLVTPMRADGTELLAGVTVDPSLGPVLAVGLGGVWVEVLRDTALRVLPAGPAQVRTMLGELRGLPLLRGARGTVPADLDALAAVIARIGETALSLGRGLRALEVNPLLVNGDRIEALDVLIITEPHGDLADGAP
jgi:acyl-CoA synthetase (NDP forming)